MKLLTSHDNAENNAAELPGTVVLANDADPMDLPLDGVKRIDLHFPKFTDGRAFRIGHTWSLRLRPSNPSIPNAPLHNPPLILPRHPVRGE